MRPSSPDAHTLPAAHVLHLVDLVARWGVADEDVLGPHGLARDALADPSAQLPVPTVVRLVETARTLTGEPGLGIFLGLQMQISWHGYLGFAALASPTVGAALDVAARFAPTRTTAVGLHLRRDGGTARLALEERADFGSARDVLVFALLVGIARIGAALTGRVLPGHAEVAFHEPPYWSRFVAPGLDAVRFGRPAHQLVFDAELLDLPLTMADPVAQRIAREACERQLEALGAARTMAARVRALLASEAGPRDVEGAADALAVSTRTLKRRLAAEGETFSALLDADRRARALDLLATTERTLEDIAGALGYSDVANFTRAFRRWTGSTPAAYRRAARG